MDGNGKEEEEGISQRRQCSILLFTRTRSRSRSIYNTSTYLDLELEVGSVSVYIYYVCFHGLRGVGFGVCNGSKYRRLPYYWHFFAVLAAPVT